MYEYNMVLKMEYKINEKWCDINTEWWNMKNGV